MGRKIAYDNDCGFMVTSARTGHNTQAAFEQICQMILEAQGHTVYLDTCGSDNKMTKVKNKKKYFVHAKYSFTQLQKIGKP